MEGAGWKAQLQSSLVGGKFRFFKGKEGSLWKCLPFYDFLAFLNGFCLVASFFFSHSVLKMRNPSEIKANAFYY